MQALVSIDFIAVLLPKQEHRHFQSVLKGRQPNFGMGDFPTLTQIDFVFSNADKYYFGQE